MSSHSQRRQNYFSGLTQKPQSAQAIAAYLNSFDNFERTLDRVGPADFQLERFQRLMSLLGDPQKRLRCLHVAGTKGKGSTCAFLASILQQAGYSVGLYTSPHLYDLRERIRILRPGARQMRSSELFSNCISLKEFYWVLNEVGPFLEECRRGGRFGSLTYFEVLTALAICYFVKQGVDYAVLETGLGGRLDATNVVEALAVAITPISLEHTQILGNTLEKIAREKAAIIKEGRGREKRFAVLAPQEPTVMKILKARCRRQGVKAICVGQDIRYQILNQNLHEQRIIVKGRERQYHLRTKLLGEHQAMNAAVALGLVECLNESGVDVPRQAVKNGVAATRWPGRFEVVKQKPVIIIDGAHNPKSCSQLVETLRMLFPNQKITFIVGMAKDKDSRGMFAAFKGIAREVILTKARHPRAKNLLYREIKDIIPRAICRKAKSVALAIKLALTETAKDGVIVITGSLFLVSEARRMIMKKET